MQDREDLPHASIAKYMKSKNTAGEETLHSEFNYPFAKYINTTALQSTTMTSVPVTNNTSGEAESLMNETLETGAAAVQVCLFRPLLVPITHPVLMR